MTRKFVFMPFEHYPTTFVVTIGDGLCDTARRLALENYLQHENVQSCFFEPYTNTYDGLRRWDKRIDENQRFINFIDLWRYFFSPRHKGCWEWLLCRSL